MHRCQREGSARNFKMALVNEVNRSMGLLDFVPEVFVEPVIHKLKFIHQLVPLGRAENAIRGDRERLEMSGGVNG